MFLVIQGNFCQGFKFTGPFENYDLAAAWLIHQAPMLGKIIELQTTNTPDETGKIVLIFGDPIDGFMVVGTFPNYSKAEAHRKESCPLAWVTELNEV